MEQRHAEWLEKQSYLKKYLIDLVAQEETEPEELKSEKIIQQFVWSKREIWRAKYHIDQIRKVTKLYAQHKPKCDFMFECNHESRFRLTCKHKICGLCLLHCKPKLKTIWGPQKIICLICGSITSVLYKTPRTAIMGICHTPSTEQKIKHFNKKSRPSRNIRYPATYIN